MSNFDEKRGDSPDEWDTGRHKDMEDKGYRMKLIPLLIRHEPTMSPGSRDQLWLAKHQRAPQWLDLLYDLVIVAILTVFSSGHEISSGESAVTYLAYFVIIWWIWASQVFYDVRFESNDWLHRFFKFCQLGAFAFVGVTAQNFDPQNVLPPADATSATAATESGGAASWTGVATSYAAGRVFLIAQYLCVIWTTRGHKRHLASLVVPIVSSFISGVLWAISAAMDGNAAAKVSMAYSGLVLEYVTTFILPFSAHYMKTPSAITSERFGALSLIIVGEGIIGVVRSFSAVMAGFGFSKAAYAQCFCALVIISGLWHLLFHGFNVEIRMGRKRGVLWLILHILLHFSILLLLTGMRNAATFGNISHAIDVVGDNIVLVYNDISAGNVNTTLPMDYLTLQFAKLGISPSWPDEVNNVKREYFDPNNTIDPIVDLIQYQTQVYVSIAQFYDVHLSSEVMGKVRVIQSLNTTLSSDQSTWNATWTQNIELADEFSTAYSTDLGQGVLFFLPCAGGVLFVLSILTLCRNPPVGRWMWMSWAVQFAGALGLGFLGFLDLGDKTIREDMDPIPVYKLLGGNWMLPVVAITYAVLIMIDSLLTLLAARHDRHAPSMPRAAERPDPPVSQDSPSSVEPVAMPFGSPDEGSAAQGSHDSQSLAGGSTSKKDGA